MKAFGDCFLPLCVAFLVSPQLVAAETRTVATAKGGAVSFVVDGAGPAVVLIPSLGRGAGDFDDLAKRLTAAGFSAVRPQPRGIGGSKGAMDGITLHDLAEDVATAIESLKSGPAIVVGHAFGQRVARMLATDRPDLVNAVVLLACGGKEPMKPGAEEALAGCFALSAPEKKRMEDVRFAFFAHGNDPQVWRDGWYPEVAKSQHAANQATPVAGWWKADAKTALLVVQGLQDVVAPPENGRALKKELGERVELIELDGAGHALLPERPAEIAKAVIAFAKKRRP